MEARRVQLCGAFTARRLRLRRGKTHRAFSDLAPYCGCTRAAPRNRRHFARPWSVAASCGSGSAGAGGLVSLRPYATIARRSGSSPAACPRTSGFSKAGAARLSGERHRAPALRSRIFSNDMPLRIETKLRCNGMLRRTFRSFNALQIGVCRRSNSCNRRHFHEFASVIALVIDVNARRLQRPAHSQRQVKQK